MHIPSVLRTSSSSSWSVVVAAVDLAGASAVDVFVVVVDIVVVASYASHNKQLVPSGSDIRIGCSVLVAASKGFLYRRRNFERLFMQMDGNKLGIWCRVRSIPLKHNI